MRVYLKSYSSAKCLTGSEESSSQYFYHSDHLGSAQLVTNQDGEVYQRIEYTPYGETWIDMRTNITALYDVPYRFTAKELDSETGLYYYGARYLDPKYSRWISTDPALGDYIPAAGKANAKDMANLPGMGGIFNHINGNLFAYAANNPVRYIDPDGNFFGSFYANEKFKETLNFYCNQYEKKLLALKNYNLQSDKIIIPANNTFELAVDCDSKQADNYIGNDVKQFAQKCLGYEKGSDSYNKYISDEKARYNRLQELRKSKNSDGSNNAHKVNNILDEASVIFKEEQKSAYKQGLSSTEINIRAEQKANDYIDAMLEKEGF